jgi:hypothetical protein
LFLPALVLPMTPQAWTGGQNEAELPKTEIPNGFEFDSFPL